jgi:hypothetical protein
MGHKTEVLGKQGSGLRHVIGQNTRGRNQRCGMGTEEGNPEGEKDKRQVSKARARPLAKRAGAKQGIKKAMRM